MPSVLIIMGSASDRPVAERAERVLDELAIPCETRVASAHRTPDRVREIVEGSDATAFIAIAGLAAALPGAVAAHTLRPVIGVPVSGKLNLDALLAIAQMPPGIPVACVGLDRGDNAALLAAQILATGDAALAERVREHRTAMARKVAESDPQG